MCRPPAKASVFERLQKKPGPVSPRQRKKTRQANGLDGAIQTRLRMDAVPSKTGPSNDGFAEDHSSPDVEEDTALAKTASGLSGVNCSTLLNILLTFSSYFGFCYSICLRKIDVVAIRPFVAFRE